MAMKEHEAATQFDLGLGIEPIDPREEPEIPSIHLKWPDRQRLDVEQFIGSYDRRSDTFMLHFYGRGREAVSVEVSTYVNALVDPESEEVIGFQLEGFLAHVVRQCPVTVDLLEFAELRGITVAEVRELRREVLGLRGRIAERIRHPIEAPAPQMRRLMRLFDQLTPLDGFACI